MPITNSLSLVQVDDGKVIEEVDADDGKVIEEVKKEVWQHKMNECAGLTSATVNPKGCRMRGSVAETRLPSILCMTFYLSVETCVISDDP